MFKFPIKVQQIINLIMTLLIAISITFVSENNYWWIGIIGGSLVQIVFLFIQSLEESSYYNRINHLECIDELDRKKKLKAKKIADNNYIKMKQLKANQVLEKLSQGDKEGLVKVES
jgi:c-di-AMP phosphodiesterase-like protein